MEGKYENGLGPDQILVNPQPCGGRCSGFSVVNSFDTNADNRRNQDIGGWFD
jgi:hypothetical protein